MAQSATISATAEHSGTSAESPASFARNTWLHSKAGDQGSKPLKPDELVARAP
jgi:hypothetical protein